MMYVLNAEENRETNTEIKTGWERGELKQTYYTTDGESQPETYHSEDTEHYESADYFSDPALAADVARAQTIWRKLMRWQVENDKPVDWSDNGENKKWFIFYNYYTGKFSTKYVFGGREAFNVYFSTKEKAEQALETFHDDLLWLFTEFKYRLDGDAE